MCSMCIYGSYIIGQNISLNKTFGQSLNQFTKSQFISQAACTSWSHIIQSVRHIQLLDKPALEKAQRAAGHTESWSWIHKAPFPYCQTE